MRKLLFTLSLVALSLGIFAQSGDIGRQVTFRFVSGNDMFFIPYGGNGTELNRLYALIDEYHGQIKNGEIPVYVDSYAASMPDRTRNARLAFTRANRVKSELILHKGLAEEHFITKNHVATYTANDGRSYRDVVVVTIHIPTREAPKAEVKPEPRHEESAAVERQPEPVVEQQPEPQVVAYEPAPKYSRWSVGANVGMPFFWGDMTSLSADKTYIGTSVGLQGTCQISPLLGMSLSLDWVQNKTGSRDYAKGYLLDPQGMTWYTPQPVTTVAYGVLYSKINMFSAGLHLDVNVLRLLDPRMANGRVKLIASPALYSQHFSSEVYTKSDNKVYVGDGLSKDLSLGLGGDVVVRYNVNPGIDLQLKGTGIWITDNNFDNIVTVGHVKQNAMWGLSAGVVWKIGGQCNTNLLYKQK